jgi:alginate O-acetyltransferase complex protein AlgI
LIFNTYWFSLFVLGFFPVYWLLRLAVARGAWLLLACVLFHYHFAGPAGVLPIIVLGLVTYFCALTRRRWLVTAAIVVCVAALVGYKYTYFFCADLLGAWDPAWGAGASAAAHRWLPLAAPLGISFFAFEFVHYLVDVRRGHEPMRRPHEFMLFSIFFPSLVAGPIKRYEDFLPKLHRGLEEVSVVDVAEGFQRIGIGLVKKMVLADNLTLIIKSYEGRMATLRTGEAWTLFVLLGARILLDFSGYSDIAIGLARLMGIALPENFNFPYLARNIRDFWQRWHISLSSWIRDYVYIPLGGSRHGPARKLFNGIAAFALCGAWHGPAWHFILWGLWHGSGLAISSTYATWLGPLGQPLQTLFTKVPLVSWALTMLFVGLGWLLFFYEPTRAWSLAARLVGHH